MKAHWFLLVAVAGVGVVLADQTRRQERRLGSFEIVRASGGFGHLLPHKVPELDSGGNPTGRIVKIRRYADLLAHVRETNPILPTGSWPTAAVLSNGDAGNHFVYAAFNQRIGIDSVLESAAAAAVDSNLTGNIRIVQVDPDTLQTIPVRGRAFINGFTYGSPDMGDPSQLLLEKWIGVDANRKPVALDPRGVGFPGTESTTPFAGMRFLVDPRSFVFIPDSDGDLSTHEPFPSGVQLQMVIREDVLSRAGTRLAAGGLASGTVGIDTVQPELLVPIVPGNGDTDVDPETSILVAFTEPIQLLTVGDLDDGTPPALSAAIQVQFGPTTSKVDVPFTVRPPSIYDLATLELTPAYSFPGSGPGLPGISCGDLSQVDVLVNPDEVEDLPGNPNTQAAATFFTTGEGPGLVNAPVTPDTITIARGGSEPGISVLDLNGFGQGTGNPTYDVQNPVIEGNSNFPNNPNVSIQGSLLVPPLAPGTCTVDGGASGVMRLALDSSLNDRLAGQPQIESVGDMALGHPLDTSFNNGSPFGCQAGGGNICAQLALKNTVILRSGGSTVGPINTSSGTLVNAVSGLPNTVSWAPHPNPPRLVFPPLCLSPLIGGEEPTSIDSVLLLSLTNLLVPSDFPFGDPSLQIPPQGLLVQEQNTFFEGPSPPQAAIQLCQPYVMRQQVGQFLYVVDRTAAEIVVFNSNRFLVVDRVGMPDPTSLAMSPNLDFLAVTNQAADQVLFLDIDPASPSFHQVVATTDVGAGPTGIAWTPDNEDILVCNTDDDSVSVISAFDLGVRKTVTAPGLNGPLDVAITPRQNGIGLLRNVYFGYVVCADGAVAVYESGPDGPNGWGYDTIVGFLPFAVDNPKAIQPDPLSTKSVVWIAHENQLGRSGEQTGLMGGAFSRVGITGGGSGQMPLVDSVPRIRDIDYGVLASIGSDVLTGIPVDFAFDDQMNLGVLPNIGNPFSAGTPLEVNGKSVLKEDPWLGKRIARTPRFVFLAVPSSIEGPGVLDVLDMNAAFARMDTNVFVPGIQSLPVSGVSGVVDYFRQ